MRSAFVAAVVLAGLTALSQNTTIRTTVPLVVVPTSVTDRSGHPIYGLTADDFEVLDDGKPRAIRVDPSDAWQAPIALVVLVQSNGFSWAALDKIVKVGAMIPEAVVGANGEAAVVSFSDDVQVMQDFTQNSDLIENSFRDLKPVDAKRARMIDAVEKALEMLAARPGARRRSILIIGETKDRGSESRLDDLISKTQRLRVTIYALNYSAWLTPFTVQPEEYNPYGDYTEAIVQLTRLARKNTAQALVEATGGRRIRFETKSKLENDLIALGSDLHSRYLVSFTPDQVAQTAFHKIEVRVKSRPDAVVKARPGYWAGMSSSQ